MEATTLAELGTAAGTLVLAVATFASVRSANQSAKLQERALQSAIRPLLLPSQLSDDAQKVGFADSHWVKLAGGRATAEVEGDNVYLTMSLRNVGPGVGVLHAWQFHPDRLVGPRERPDADTFTRLNRDLYLPAGGLGFWQGAFRDRGDPQFDEAERRIKDREPFTVDLLYGDIEGGQRMISRFSVLPGHDEGWLPVVSHHWNVDRDDPR